VRRRLRSSHSPNQRAASDGPHRLVFALAGEQRPTNLHERRLAAGAEEERTPGELAGIVYLLSLAITLGSCRCKPTG